MPREKRDTESKERYREQSEIPRDKRDTDRKERYRRRNREKGRNTIV